MFASISKDKVCASGCHGRHITVPMLGIFDWSMKIMLGGAHPLTKHDIEPVDAQKSLLAGGPLGFSGGLFQARGDWAWYQQLLGFPHVCEAIAFCTCTRTKQV